MRERGIKDIVCGAAPYDSEALLASPDMQSVADDIEMPELVLIAVAEADLHPVLKQARTEPALMLSDQVYRLLVRMPTAATRATVAASPASSTPSASRRWWRCPMSAPTPTSASTPSSSS